MKEQGTRSPAEWLLVLGCLLRRRSGASGDLCIARLLLHAYVGWRIVPALSSPSAAASRVDGSRGMKRRRTTRWVPTEMNWV